MWRDRTGFVKISAQHGYKLVPFSSVGSEDMVSNPSNLHTYVYARSILKQVFIFCL
jgi:hypothetical protein